MGSLSSAAIIVLLLLFLSFSLSFSSSPVSKSQKSQLLSKRSLFDAEDDQKPTQKSPPLKKKPILGTKNQTNLLKPKKTNSTAAAAAIPKATNSSKPKLKKALTDAAAAISKATNGTKLKLSKALIATNEKPSNSTKLLKSIKPTKSNSTKSNSAKLSKIEIKPSTESSSAATSTKSSKKSFLDPPPAKNKASNSSSASKSQQATKPIAKKKPAKPSRSTAWMEELDDDGSDLISDFRELPSRLLPDLERLSTNSKAYISAANRGIAEGMRPYVGKSFAPRVAPVLSSLFLALPLVLLGLLFRRLRAYLSLHRLLIFIQAYLAIYFATLALTALLTGLEPLRFFYATSPGSYAWTQAAQTMGYLVYLVVQLVDLVVVFAGGKEEAGGGAAAARGLGLAQMVIGLGVGAHYYVAVFHRAVAGEAPRANWRVHAVYAACFVVICACARAERRKKFYDGGEDGKKS